MNGTVPFVGDLSLADAQILATLASKSHRILEFGVGGSTQIFAQCAPPKAEIISVDTSHEWIARTIANFQKLELPNRVVFIDWSDGVFSLKGKFDLIFIDCVDTLRLESAKRSWPMLAIGGSIAFHDTRRKDDLENVLDVISLNYLEVESARFNLEASNISVVTKKIAQPYVNWNVVEGKEPWMYGQGDPPDQK